MRSSSRRFDTPPSRRFAEIRHRLVVEAQRLLRDLELQVELAQQEIVRRDVADERHEHAAPALLARQHQRQRRFVLPPEPAEQIDLPRQLESVGAALMRRVVVLVRRVGAFDACRTP